jgi:hypothetical protein
MIRILDMDHDADARLITMIMHLLGRHEIVITHDDEMAVSCAMQGRTVVVGVNRQSGEVTLRVVDYNDLPVDGEALH